MVRTVKLVDENGPGDLLPDDGMAGLFLCVADVEAALLEQVALNGSQFRILSLLQLSAGQAPMSEIPGELMLHRSTISTCLKQLEEKGLVSRVYSGRNARVVLTSSGMRAASNGAVACDDSLRQIWGFLDEGSRRTSQFLNAASGLRGGRAAFKNGQLDVSLMTFDNMSKTKAIFKTSAQSQGLSPNEARVLNCVARHSRSMGDISAATLLSAPQVTIAVKSLESKGLVARKASHVDKRIVKVRPADSGRESAEAVASEYGSRIEALLGQVSEEERRFYERIASVLAGHYRRLS